MTDIRKIEITEEVLKLGTVTYYAGDIKSFPKAEADEYIRLGWAKCCETGETGERKPGAEPINVQSVLQTVG
jgi:hypothetical protein